MTQKEYKEKIEELERKIVQLTNELEVERNKNYDYERVLKDYYIANEDLKKEKVWNRENVNEIENQRKIIERYEKILDKFTISYGG